MTSTFYKENKIFMAIPSPTQSTPGGCVIGAIALIPAVISGLGIWGMIVWLQLPAESHHFDTRFWVMLSAIVIGGLLTVILAWISYRSLKSTDFTDYDSKDPNNTNMKW